MQAMLLNRICDLRTESHPLVAGQWPDPLPGRKEIRIKVSACGVCHTELDEIEGRTPPPAFPVIPGHQVVGVVDACGQAATRFPQGQRVGVAWIYSACGRCDQCRAGLENLCPEFKATGRDAHGGYAQWMTVAEDFAHPIPDSITDLQAAPLLCAGAIGYRSLKLTGLKDGQALGLTGFGASGHLVLKLAAHQYPASPVLVFARSSAEREFARELGAVWAGDTTSKAPQSLAAIIDTTPAWTPVLSAMENLKPGGRLVINAIRKEERDKAVLKTLDYTTHLWLEKEIKTVANITRSDVGEFLDLAAEIPIQPEVREFALSEANRALLELKQRKIRGAKVLTIS